MLLRALLSRTLAQKPAGRLLPKIDSLKSDKSLWGPSKGAKFTLHQPAVWPGLRTQRWAGGGFDRLNHRFSVSADFSADWTSFFHIPKRRPASIVKQRPRKIRRQKAPEGLRPEQQSAAEDHPEKSSGHQKQRYSYWRCDPKTRSPGTEGRHACDRLCAGGERGGLYFKGK